VLQEDYIAAPTFKSFDVQFPHTVEAGHVFCMGDNRNNSEDSRFADVGFVPFDLIKGKAMLVFWPVGQFKTLP
jgi:signal peptidase I